MDLLDQLHRTGFLGVEFLTWLWFETERTHGEFALDEEFGEFELYFDDKLVVGSTNVDAQENFFKGGHPTSSLEARTALRLGKMAHDAKLRIVRGTQEWVFSLRGHDMAISGVKIPAVLSKEDDDRFYERMFLLEQLDQMIKGLFEQFLVKRLDATWKTEMLPALQTWIAGSS